MSKTKTVRAKFTCYGVKNEGGTEVVSLAAVTDGSEENWSFWKATPQGQLNMSIDNPAAQGFFESGKSYYLDFKLA